MSQMDATADLIKSLFYCLNRQFVVYGNERLMIEGFNDGQWNLLYTGQKKM